MSATASTAISSSHMTPGSKYPSTIFDIVVDVPDGLIRTRCDFRSQVFHFSLLETFHIEIYLFLQLFFEAGLTHTSTNLIVVTSCELSNLMQSRVTQTPARATVYVTMIQLFTLYTKLTHYNTFSEVIKPGTRAETHLKDPNITVPYNKVPARKFCSNGIAAARHAHHPDQVIGYMPLPKNTPRSVTIQ